ncbi:DNA methyltransferase [Thermospira aquatica]|uniref:site-specific DNA-methyltransferase (adenine-specific) n=1 Tax=Thermospira aquatica TaxID=2828656 RepID=A0AAX3BAG6_9SPIR|nr:site-specific DNA-methyltransferase [Thermospira aquatica]URA09245.1 site-specific DNA-methyltransferase [Thermospira aquatica]
MRGVEKSMDNTKNLLNHVKDLLQKDERLVVNGELMKNKIIELALKLDKDFIELLLSDPRTKEMFFLSVGEVMIFDKDKFIRFIANKQFLPDSYTAFKNKIGLIDEKGEFISEKKDVVLSWPYKDCVLEGGMTKEDQKRDEIFWNETLAPDEISRLLEPKVFTNAKRIDKDGEHKFDGFGTDEKGDIKDNLLIKGNNLLILHSLKKRFAGKVKLIYIDPPYNPDSAANTFSYNNRFNHSTWLTFMKNRIEVAKTLLTLDGFFCIAIDHNELFYLGVLCDEIFGRENRIGIIAVETNPGGRSDSLFFATSHENFFVYARDITKAKINNLKMDEQELKQYKYEDEISRYKLVPLRRTGSNSTPDKRPNLYFPIFYDPKNKQISLEKKSGYIEILPIGADSIKRVWRWSKEKILSNLNDIEVKESKSGYMVFVKDRLRLEKKPKTLWHGSRYDASSYGTKLLQKFKLKGEFSYPKPLYLIKDIIQILSDKESIVLDFTAGSGTTAHALLELNKEDGGNRRFILCEQMDYVETITKERIKKLIKDRENDFVYLELMKWNEHFVEKIQQATTKEELAKLWETMKEKAFLSSKVDSKEVDKNAKDFEDLSLEDQKRLLLEALDKNHLYVNYSEIDDEAYGVSEEDKKLNRGFYEE